MPVDQRFSATIMTFVGSVPGSARHMMLTGIARISSHRHAGEIEGTRFDRGIRTALPQEATGINRRLQLAVSALTKILAGVVALLVITSISGQIIARLLDRNPQDSIFFEFDVNNEFNIPTAFETAEYLACALALAAIAALAYLTRDRWARYWAGLSVGFVVLAWDESFVLHEKFIEPTRSSPTSSPSSHRAASLSTARATVLNCPFVIRGYP